MNQIGIKKSDPRVARFVKLCFPADRTRRAVKVSARETCYVRDYWDGGSRDYTEFVHIPTMSRRSLDSLDFEKQTNGNPYKTT